MSQRDNMLNLKVPQNNLLQTRSWVVRPCQPSEPTAKMLFWLFVRCHRARWQILFPVSRDLLGSATIRKSERGLRDNQHWGVENLEPPSGVEVGQAP